MVHQNGPQSVAEHTENDAPAGLQVGDAVLGNHCAKCNTSNRLSESSTLPACINSRIHGSLLHLPVRNSIISKVSYCSSINTALLLLQLRDELHRLDFGCTADGASAKHVSQAIVNHSSNVKLALGRSTCQIVSYTVSADCASTVLTEKHQSASYRAAAHLRLQRLDVEHG